MLWPSVMRPNKTWMVAQHPPEPVLGDAAAQMVLVVQADIGGEQTKAEGRSASFRAELPRAWPCLMYEALQRIVVAARAPNGQIIVPAAGC
jgi:hypothetical protein